MTTGTGPVSPESAESPEITGEGAAALKVNELFYQAIENADMDLMEVVWVTAEDADGATCIHPGQSAIHGLSKIMRSWAVVCSRINYLQFFITDAQVRQVGDVAIVTCVENVLSEMPGQESASMGFGGSHYEAINVFRRTGPGGQWRLLTHCSAPVFPPPDPSDTDGRPV
jgi:ketosteroid isomerase-like protein